MAGGTQSRPGARSRFTGRPLNPSTQALGAVLLLRAPANRSTQLTRNMPRPIDNINPATRPGNNRRAFTPDACRRRYAHWTRQYAIAEASARREAQQRRRKS
jgi:hypothetical protein